jgi:hypothetical protein
MRCTNVLKKNSYILEKLRSQLILSNSEVLEQFIKLLLVTRI